MGIFAFYSPSRKYSEHTPSQYLTPEKQTRGIPIPKRFSLYQSGFALRPPVTERASYPTGYGWAQVLQILPVVSIILKREVTLGQPNSNKTTVVAISFFHWRHKLKSNIALLQQLRCEQLCSIHLIFFSELIRANHISYETYTLYAWELR